MSNKTEKFAHLRLKLAPQLVFKLQKHPYNFVKLKYENYNRKIKNQKLIITENILIEKQGEIQFGFLHYNLFKLDVTQSFQRLSSVCLVQKDLLLEQFFGLTYLKLNQNKLLLNYISSMLLPKLPYNQKQKLILQQKPLHKIQDHQLLNTVQKILKQNLLLQPNNKSRDSKQINLRSHSSSFKRKTQISHESLQSRKKDLVEKQNYATSKLKKNMIPTSQKPSLRLNLPVDKTVSMKSSSNNSIGLESCSENFRKKQTHKDQIMQNSLEINQNRPLNSQFSIQSFKTNENSIDNGIQFHEKNNMKNQNEPQNEIIFSDQQNSIFFNRCDFPLRNAKRNTVVRRSRKYSRIIANSSLSLNYTVLSLQINSENPQKQFTNKKRAIIEELSKDPDFQWKYLKFKQYAQKYSQYEIKLKENFQVLEFLTQNLQLIRERIAPFKSIESLTELVQTLKPTLTQKQQNAYQIKMEMLEWKKKFFTNITKIKQDLNKTVEQKYETVFLRLNQNESVLCKLQEILDQFTKKETELLAKEDFQNLKKIIEPIMLNQKQMVDEIKICERNGEYLLDKFNTIESQWSHTFDIFNSTLENCVNKCDVLSDMIEKFYGKCSEAMFLTNGLNMQHYQDTKMLENNNCHVCKWNQTKLKKIIEENSLAKDHLKALKHLIAN